MFKLIQDNTLIILLLIAVIGVGGTLMVVSQKVYEKETAVSQKSRELVEQEWELRTLKAEWAYLSRPDRIDELSSAMGQSAKAVIVAMQPTDDTVDNGAVEPVSMTLSVPTPPNKPFYMIRASAPMKRDANSIQKPSADADFSSLLKTIGGGE